MQNQKKITKKGTDEYKWVHRKAVQLFPNLPMPVIEIIWEYDDELFYYIFNSHAKNMQPEINKLHKKLNNLINHVKYLDKCAIKFCPHNKVEHHCAPPEYQERTIRWKTCKLCGISIT